MGAPFFAVQKLFFRTHVEKLPLSRNCSGVRAKRIQSVILISHRRDRDTTWLASSAAVAKATIRGSCPCTSAGPAKSSQTSLLDTILCVCAPHELPAGVKTQDVPFHFAVEDDHAALITVRYMCYLRVHAPLYIYRHRHCAMFSHWPCK